VATWREMSEDSLRAAEALLREGRYRSSISRSYYAAYCAATHEIVQKLTTFSHGWKNPSHEKVPVYVQNNLTISQVKKDAVVRLIGALRLLREDADYRPQENIDAAAAQDCIRDARDIQQELWGATVQT
jgi:uncharacterized protein (UPF0332 family)